MEDYVLTLFDRINVIRDTINKYGEDKFYIAFSGGKDSTMLHYLIDMALPNNKIPRVYINTGIEYIDMIKFVRSMAENDERIIMIKPSKNITQTLQKYGYPFKSKQHSHLLNFYQNIGLESRAVRVYLDMDKSKNGNSSFRSCPIKLKYQFTEEFTLKISDKCCLKLKKEPMHMWAVQNNKTINITGMRAQEGGTRRYTGCIITDKNGYVTKFNPLIKVTDEFENWFIEKYNIKLCKLYYPPFNFERTGCRGCPFALHLQKELDILKELLPIERNACELIWKPVYEEYRRIGYRLRKEK